MKLTYFSVMAKGLGPAICCELSGLDWDGPKSSGFNADTDWAALKPTTPFGQLPLLEVDGLRIAQCVAIVNYIGKKAGTDGHGRAEFATSQMLLAEAEDIYAGLQKFCATAFVPLEKKCTPQEAAAWWDGGSAFACARSIAALNASTRGIRPAILCSRRRGLPSSEALFRARSTG